MRSGVSGGSVPLHGGVVLDLGAIAGLVDVDDVSLVVDVRPGTFGSLLEDELRSEHRATLGHWPQSIELSGRVPARPPPRRDAGGASPLRHRRERKALRHW